jgi:phage tail-like protein
MPAPEFQINADRCDPYKNFRFRVKWDGQYVAGMSKVTGLARTTQQRTGPTVVRCGPGQTEFAAITMERGVTYDVAFEQWANKVWDYKNTAASVDSPNERVSLKDFRKDIVIEIYNEVGQKVLAYEVHKCWVSDCQATPELDGTGDGVAIQRITLQNEGWESDTSISEPTEPSFTIPRS